MNERIKKIRKEIKLTQIEFAEICGVTQRYISEIESGKQKTISAEVFYKITKKFNINPDWLLTGEGDMFLKTGNATYGNNSSIITGNNNTVNYNLSQGEAELVDAVREKDGKKLLKLIAKLLSVFSLVVTGIIYLKCGWV